MASSYQTIVRAFNKEGYQRDILVIDEQQVRMSDRRVNTDSIDGVCINPKEFPEMVKFTIIVKELKR